ncbi:MAG: TetR/AcrR family transcriptional regulator, partial [Bacteroidales bacterium]|nr:TetR/AcrR family transcriptional regulator [Bacteroidales bacterium]
MERDREATEKRLLETIGEMIAEQGFENLGVNAVAAQAGVSKILIYRYFGSLDGLIAAYIRQHDFWLASSFDFSDTAQIVPAVKEMFRRHMERLQQDPILRKLYRWELSSNNEMVKELREQREKVGLALIKQVCKRTGRPQQEIAAMSSLVTASVTYLAMLGD